MGAPDATAAVYNGYTAAELQAQYSARAAVPEHPEIFARWRQASDDYRAQARDRAWLDLAYGPGERQRIDVFHPDGDTAAPLHVFFHGGYWQAMDRRDFSFIARALNARGIAVAVVGYTLCPATTVAGIVEEARGAVSWLQARRERLRLTTAPLQLSGHSAGGHLAAMVAANAARHADAGREAIDTVGWIAPISGVFELEPLVHTALNEALALDVSTARILSPSRPPSGALPAIDAWVGGRESREFHRQSSEFIAQWEGQTNGARLYSVPGCNHFTVLDHLFAEGSDLVERARERAWRDAT